MKIISLVQKLPLDLGQADRKHNTAGKNIALSFIKRSRGKKALDIGCRDGYWSEVLKKKGYKTKSLDIEPHYKSAIKCDVEDGIPFKDNSFDLVWCTEVIEHLKNPRFLISEIDRVAKKDSTVIITTPNSAWWGYWILKMFGVSPKSVQNKDHKQFFNIKSIKKIAPEYRVYGYFPYAFLFLRIRYFIGFLSPTFVLIRNK